MSVFETLCRPQRTMTGNRKKRRSRHIAAFWAALWAGHAHLTTMGMPQIKSNRGYALLSGGLRVADRVDRYCKISGPLFRLDNSSAILGLIHVIHLYCASPASTDTAA
jgi:hypothetical protein